MEHFIGWENFWKEWRNKDIETENDLYFQVGKTVHNKPIEKEIFDRINEGIVHTLDLSEEDILVELCCGNGLCTYEFRDKVKQIMAVDFAPHLIEAAVKFKSATNISYTLGSVTEFLASLESKGVHPAKYLMNDSLAYFKPEDLKEILTLISGVARGAFKFLIRGVPNDLLKWNFYNTDERKQRYHEYVAKGDITNDGLGRWWSPAEIEQICHTLGLDVVIRNQEPPVSNYRMDILISK